MRISTERIRKYLNEILQCTKKIKTFFDFRNALIYRYWQIDDDIFLHS
jgi:uncharacterized protein YutE (UPF0331/DUF86 family)